MPSLQPDPACPAGRRPQQVNIPERPYHPKAPDTPPSPRRNQPVQYRREFKMIVGIGVFEFRVQIVFKHTDPMFQNVRFGPRFCWV